MTVLHAVRTATISSQAEPAAAPLRSAPPRTAQPVGRDRPLTADERMCAIGLTLMAVVLGSIIVAFLLLAELVWV